MVYGVSKVRSWLPTSLDIPHGLLARRNQSIHHQDRPVLSLTISARAILLHWKYAPYRVRKEQANSVYDCRPAAPAYIGPMNMHGCDVLCCAMPKCWFHEASVIWAQDAKEVCGVIKDDLICLARRHTLTAKEKNQEFSGYRGCICANACMHWLSSTRAESAKWLVWSLGRTNMQRLLAKGRQNNDIAAPTPMRLPLGQGM
eukprot:1158892-Pelagomonas_calceolata.AAC.4